MKLCGLLVLALAAACVAACGDPVHDDAVAALGPENPAIPVGPLHRAGQPCLVCHDGSGPAALAFGTAGTVFQDAMNATPLPAVTIEFTDANMNVTSTQSNCAGNFFVEAVDFASVAMPVHIQILYGSMVSQMLTHMSKNDSCADCHTGTPSPSSTFQLFMNQDPMQYPASGCQ